MRNPLSEKRGQTEGAKMRMSRKNGGTMGMSQAFGAVLVLSLMAGCAQPQGEGLDGGMASDGFTQRGAVRFDDSADAVSLPPMDEVTVTPDGTEIPSDSPMRKQISVDMIPCVSQLPEGRTSGEVSSALVTYMVEHYPNVPVSSVELLGSGMEGDALWASYLVHLGGTAGDVGISVACTPKTPPVLQEAQLLKVMGHRQYDVFTKGYSDVDDGGDDVPSEEDSSEPAPGNEEVRSELSPPESIPVLVEDDQGNKVWVVPHAEG